MGRLAPLSTEPARERGKRANTHAFEVILARLSKVSRSSTSEHESICKSQLRSPSKGHSLT
jgi:hypothetical protein